MFFQCAELDNLLSKPTKSRPRSQLSRAEIKAYEARRAAQGAQAPASTTRSSTATGARSQARKARTLSRTEEFGIIKADMKRLLIILAILLFVLVAATVVLR